MRFADLGDVGQAVVRVVKIECVDEVAQVPAAPLIELLRIKRLAARLGPLLEEENVALMCGVLREHAAIPCKR